MDDEANHALLVSDFFRELIYPDHPAFYEVLHSSLPPGSEFNDLGKTFVVDALSGELRQIKNDSELDDYVLGGEFDEATLNFSLQS